jgi:hypothetical protein
LGNFLCLHLLAIILVQFIQILIVHL